MTAGAVATDGVPEAFRRLARDWAPAATVATDVVRPTPAAEFAAAIGQPSPDLAPGAPLPALWHWFFCHDPVPRTELGADGHPVARDFLAPLDDRRRMFAGSRLDLVAPLRFGDEVRRTSRLVQVRPKMGRSGPLLFVTVERRYEVGGDVRLVEEQDFVYRRAADVAAPAGGDVADRAVPGSAVPDDARRLVVDVDSTTLFRVSALTANTHRIHYDAPYATEVEGYPGIVIHGPLAALLMLEVLGRPIDDLSRFEWRASAPMFAPERLVAWAASPTGTGVVAGVGTVDSATNVSGRATFRGEQ